jgi:hypothetical protein
MINLYTIRGAREAAFAPPSRLSACDLKRSMSHDAAGPRWRIGTIDGFESASQVISGCFPCLLRMASS